MSGQADLFGTTPKPAAKARAVRQQRIGTPATPLPAPNGHQAPEDGAASLATRLSPAELEELAATLSDDALARLVVAAVRQLRRRLARGGGRAGRRPSPALDRAAQQLAAELGGQADTDEA
jgi:hypothetical protein